MKTKLEMAHEYAIALINSDCEMQFDKFIRLCWNYADAMQAEADKREKEEAAQKRKEIREMLSAPNTFVEREGQHFDDVCSDEMQAQRDAELYGTGFLKVTYDSNGVKYERLAPETISMCSSNIGLDSQVLKEWQPDWSQAPEWAKYWAVRDGGKMALWCINKPTVTDDCFLSHGCCSPAPSFGFTGSRIVERPQ